MSIQKSTNRDRSLLNIRGVLTSALRWSLERQRPDGHWVGSVESNACMEAQWCLGLWVLGLEAHPLRARLARSLVETQRPDGSWQIYHDAPNGDVNTTVEAYAALRSMGVDADSYELVRARRWILDKGGLGNVRVFTRYWLALIGEWPWDKTPNLPPEMIWLPRWFPFSIYNFAQWARATLVPLTILSLRRLSRPLPPGRRLDELFPQGRRSFDYSLPSKVFGGLWSRMFMAIDVFLHAVQSFGDRLGWRRQRAANRVLDWIVVHQDADGAWGGIQPPWLYGLLALHAESFGMDHDAMVKGVAALDDPAWRVDRGDASWIQATNSPVWDTILTILAFEDAGASRLHPEAIGKALEWVLDRQILAPGDWSLKLPGVAPGGWAFEYANSFYPDVDDTAVALMALSSFRDDPHWKDGDIGLAIRRGIDWLLAMQCESGGWGAFDKDNDRRILTRIPFCDFGEALDPPSVDVTAHVLEAFAKVGLPRSHPAIVRGLAFIWKEQEPDGPWFGRWGVNYIYGTAAVIPALAALGCGMEDGRIHSACDWLVDRQDADGGWGETCASYVEASAAGRGDATASQTAWALMALIAAGRPEDRRSIERGCNWLMDRQIDGTWIEPQYTATGFPGYGVGQSIRLDDPTLQEKLGQGPELSRAFMLRYDLYRHYFPIMALGRAMRSIPGLTGTADLPAREDFRQPR